MKKIYTLKHILKIFRILLPVFYNFILLPVVYSQDTYSLELSDPSTFSTNCGRVNSAAWSVKDDSCTLYTPYFRKETEDTTWISYDFRINQSGNGDITDVAYIQVQRNNGVWATDTVLNASEYAAVHNLTGSLSVMYGETIRLRVILKTDSNQEFWAIFDGNITVSGSFETYGEWPGFLPVELAYFSGTSVKKEIVLKWATFSETNCDYYHILRSDDGGKYKTIAFIDGAGNSNQYRNYTYTDGDKISGKVVYYMLRQVDLDGKDTYYGPIAVDVKVLSCNLVVSPNPVTSSSTILLSFQNEQSTVNSVQVFNSTGYQILNNVVEGENLLFTLSEPGLYIVALTSDNNVEYSKLVVK